MIQREGPHCESTRIEVRPVEGRRPWLSKWLVDEEFWRGIAASVIAGSILVAVAGLAAAVAKLVDWRSALLLALGVLAAISAGFIYILCLAYILKRRVRAKGLTGVAAVMYTSFRIPVFVALTLLVLAASAAGLALASWLT